MRPYRDRNRSAAILGYAHGPRHIEVTFGTGKVYRYTHGSAGQDHVEMMKKLAAQGSGLGAYIRMHQPQHEVLK